MWGIVSMHCAWCRNLMLFLKYLTVTRKLQPPVVEVCHIFWHILIFLEIIFNMLFIFKAVFWYFVFYCVCSSQLYLLLEACLCNEIAISLLKRKDVQYYVYLCLLEEKDVRERQGELDSYWVSGSLDTGNSIYTDLKKATEEAFAK